jgi:hypothetical protein
VDVLNGCWLETAGIDADVLSSGNYKAYLIVKKGEGRGDSGSFFNG